MALPGAGDPEGCLHLASARADRIASARARPHHSRIWTPLKEKPVMLRRYDPPQLQVGSPPLTPRLAWIHYTAASFSSTSRVIAGRREPTSFAVASASPSTCFLTRHFRALESPPASTSQKMRVMVCCCCLARTSPRIACCTL